MQLQLVNSVENSLSPVLRPKLGRILKRHGPVQLSLPMTPNVILRKLFLFTDVMVVGIPHSNRIHDVFTIDLKQNGPYHCFDYNNEHILLCVYNCNTKQVFLLQANPEHYKSWANDMMIVVRSTQDYYELKNNVNKSHTECYLCRQKASLMKRLYMCWSCGSAACADCTVVVPWHFQYGCVCVLCEVDIRFHLTRL